MLEDVMQSLFMPNPDWDTGAGQVALSQSGHLAYARGGVYPGISGRIMAMTLNGEVTQVDLDPRHFLEVRVSPEDDRLAFAARDGAGVSIYVRDLVRGTTESLNTGGLIDTTPIWSSDGRSIAFTSNREDGVRNVYRMLVDGSGEPERLAPSDQEQWGSSWSSQGVIAYLQAGDIWVRPPDGEPRPFFTSDADEAQASFSPDGRFVAYTSDKTGRLEVYVRPYPGPGSETLISGDGGMSPAWSRDSRQLYFVERRAATTAPILMAADIVDGDDFRTGRAAPLINPWPYIILANVRGYDILQDGSFIGASLGGEAAGSQFSTIQERRRVGEFHMVLNFFEELRARVPN